MPILRGAGSAHQQPRDALLSPCSLRLCLSPAAFQPLQPCGLFPLAVVPGGHVLYAPVRLSASAPLPITSTLLFYGISCQCRPTPPASRTVPRRDLLSPSCFTRHEPQHVHVSVPQPPTLNHSTLLKTTNPVANPGHPNKSFFLHFPEAVSTLRDGSISLRAGVLSQCYINKQG